MTLCVAAHCHTAGRRMMILAADYESENEMVGAEIQSKVTQLDGGYFFLAAGTHTRATELIGVASNLLSDGQQVFYDVLRKAVTTQKKNLAHEYVSGQLGITYDEFIDTGKEKLPEEIYRDMVAAVRGMTLGCSLLAIDFSSEDPSIYRIQDSGMIEMCDNFAAVGTGPYIAESFLFLRAHSEHDELRSSLFEVFEAMMLGGRAPGVGDTFTILVISRDNDGIKVQQPTPAYGRYLKKSVEKYSIRGYEVSNPPKLHAIKTSEAALWGVRIKKSRPKGTS